MLSGNESKKYNAIEKALEIMVKFQDTKPSWGIRELSGELKFSPATVQRILKILKAYEFIRQDPQTRQYYIGNIFYRFLENLNNTNSLTGTGKKFMENVANKTLETVHLNVIEGSLRICINTIESPKTLKAGMSMGNQSPLYAGASAKCLLAFSSKEFVTRYLASTRIKPLTDKTIIDKTQLSGELDKIRDQGYATSLGERTPGLGSLSAPVFNYQRQILASLSLAIPEIRFVQQDHLTNCIRILTGAARSFSQALGLSTPAF